MLNVAIIDDDPLVRGMLLETIERHCPGVKVVGQAEDVKSGLALIQQQKPEVVLLDIMMPDGTGFKLLRQFEKINFKVLFVTAHEEYAIKAFRFSAFDYILKPFTPDDIRTSFDRLERAMHKNFKAQLETFISHIENPIMEDKKIVLETTDRLQVIKIKDIVRISSSNKGSVVFLNDEIEVDVEKTLVDFIDLLKDFNFITVDENNIINVKYVDYFEGDKLVMKDKKILQLAPPKKEFIIELLEKKK